LAREKLPYAGIIGDGIADNREAYQADNKRRSPHPLSSKMWNDLEEAEALNALAGDAITAETNVSG